MINWVWVSMAKYFLCAINISVILCMGEPTLRWLIRLIRQGERNWHSRSNFKTEFVAVLLFSFKAQRGLVRAAACEAALQGPQNTLQAENQRLPNSTDHGSVPPPAHSYVIISDILLCPGLLSNSDKDTYRSKTFCLDTQWQFCTHLAFYVDLHKHNLGCSVGEGFVFWREGIILAATLTQFSRL